MTRPPSLGTRAALARDERPGTVRSGRTPVGATEPPALGHGFARVVGIDCGLARVSLAYFDLAPATRGTWSRADLWGKVGTFRSCWHVTTPADMPLPDRLREIGTALTRELQQTQPVAYFVELPATSGMYRARAERMEKGGGASDGAAWESIALLNRAIGIILAVCSEQARRSGATLETRKPSQLGGKTKEERLEFVRTLLRRLRGGVELKNDNDVDAVGVALPPTWNL